MDTNDFCNCHVQSPPQRVSKKLTSTFALQGVHCAQETMICMHWHLYHRLSSVNSESYEAFCILGHPEHFKFEGFFSLEFSRNIEAEFWSRI